LEVFEIDNRGDDFLAVLKIEHKELKLFRVEFSQADVDMSFRCSFVEGGIRLSYWEHAIGKK